MRIADMNWMQVERYLERDDRAVVPIGSTEQHAYLSLATDDVLAERMAVEAAAPLGVPVFPPLNFGITPAFLAYPGTVSLRQETLEAVLLDVLDSLAVTGFRRVLVVNGHGGNSPAETAVLDWAERRPEMRVKWHDWWRAPATAEAVRAIDPQASHASWMEAFPWTSLPEVEPPAEPKPMVDLGRWRQLDADAARALLGDGSFGGAYRKPEAAMLELWRAGVQETRQVLEGAW